MIIEILQHNIDYWYENEQKMPDTEQEQVLYMIEQGYSEGELNDEAGGRGWWKIDKGQPVTEGRKANNHNSNEKTIDEFIVELQALPNRSRAVSVVVGNEDENSMDTWELELHHTHDEDHPLEIFVHEDAKQYH